VKERGRLPKDTTEIVVGDPQSRVELRYPTPDYAECVRNFCVNLRNSAAGRACHRLDQRARISLCNGVSDAARPGDRLCLRLAHQISDRKPRLGAASDSDDWYELWSFCTIWCIAVPVAGCFTVEMFARFCDSSRERGRN
jgi:hypothetical protein